MRRNLRSDSTNCRCRSARRLRAYFIQTASRLTGFAAFPETKLGTELNEEVIKVRFINAIADRMVGAVVPRISAAASCSPGQFQEACGPCTLHNLGHGQYYWTQSQKTCHYNSNCTKVTCTGCSTYSFDNAGCT
jgi:hypothetical protein